MRRDPIWKRYRDLLRPRPAEDVSDEVRFHLEMSEREARRAGRSPEQAAADARERFGDVAAVVSELNAIGGARVTRHTRAEFFADLKHDVRFALRSLRRAPAFASAGIATVAVAVAANTVIFSFVNALLIEPLPYANADRLVSVEGPIVHSIGEGLALAERATSSIDAVAQYRHRSVTLSDEDAVRVDGNSVTANLLDVVGAKPARGRWFAESSELPGNGNEIVISDGLWQQRYGRDPDIIGRKLLVDGEPYAVIGVMPPAFRFPTTADQFWVPLTVDRANLPAMWAISTSGFVARLRRGVPLERARTDVAKVVPGMRRLNPMWDPGPDYGKEMKLEPLQRRLVGAARGPLLLLFGCVGIVLLIACVNVSNLLLSRAAARQRELSIRAALGGGRMRLVRQLLVESLVVAALGGVLAVGLAWLGMQASSAVLPDEVARLGVIRINVGVLAFTAVLTLATGVTFGLLPALRATAPGHSSSGLASARGASAGAAPQRLSALLVVGEISLAVMVAITAGLLVRSFARLRDLTPGFQTTQLAAGRLSPPPASYSDRERVEVLYAGVLDRLRALPGVQDAAMVHNMPLGGAVYGMAARIEGQFEDAKSGFIPYIDHSLVVTPTFFATIGLPIMRGRGFAVADRNDAPPVAIISQSMAKHFWPSSDAIGQRIGYPFPSPWITIVGIVPDVKLDSLRDTSRMAVYLPFAQRVVNVRSGAAQDMYVVARTAGDPAALAQSIRGIIASLDRTVAVSEVRTMNEVVSHSIAKPRFTMTLVAGFAVTAVLLGMIGIYGVMSYVVSQRTREMGVRVALGATTNDIYRLVLGRGARLAAVGAGFGVAGAAIAAQSLASFLYGVAPIDPATFVAVPLMFIVIALAASYAPARRATAVDAVQALRSD
jgi:putative ABC transport system permease protein